MKSKETGKSMECPMCGESIKLSLFQSFSDLKTLRPYYEAVCPNNHRITMPLEIYYMKCPPVEEIRPSFSQMVCEIQKALNSKRDEYIPFETKEIKNV